MFCFVLTDLIKGYKNHEICYSPVVLFYSNENVSLVDLFLKKSLCGVFGNVFKLIVTLRNYC